MTTSYNGVYVASEADASISTTGTLMELQVPANVMIEVIRVWVGPSEGATPVEEIQEIELYLNNALATGGTGMTEQEIRGTTDATSGVTALGAQPAIGTSPTVILRDGYHAFNGWLYLPVPDERIRILGAAASCVGIQFPVAPDAAMNITYGMVWGEVG